MQKRTASLKNIYAAIHPERNFPQEALSAEHTKSEQSESLKVH